MEKYDKPITKTVSAFNNTVFTESNTVTGNNYCTKQKGKKKPLIFALCGVCFVAIISIILFVLLVGNRNSNSSDKLDSESSTVESLVKNETVGATTSSEKGVKTATNEISDNLFDFTFELEGDIYKLPCEYSDFVDNGWIISSGYTENTKVSGNSYVEFKMSKDDKEIRLYSYNSSGNENPLSSCCVGGIDCFVLDDVSFVIANNITPESSSDEIINSFGTPTKVTNTSDGEILQYLQNDSIYNCVKFNCSTESNEKKYSYIIMKNFIHSDDNKTEVKEEVPAYLSKYVTPESLGIDLTKGKIYIDGDLYSFPAPVSEFVNNGWEIKSKPGAVVSGGSESLTFQKNGSNLSVQIKNYAEYQTTAENCAVWLITVGAEENIPIKLPNVISFDSKKADVEKAITDSFESSESGTMYRFAYSNKEGSYYLSISCDTKSDKVCRIGLQNDNWDY